MNEVVEKAFIVYDERGVLDPDNAAVLVSCESLKEAWRYVRRTFGSGAIYAYDITKDRQAINEALVGWRSGDGREWKAEGL